MENLQLLKKKLEDETELNTQLADLLRDARKKIKALEAEIERLKSDAERTVKLP